MSLLVSVEEVRANKSQTDGLSYADADTSLSNIYLTCLIILGQRAKEGWTPKDVEAAVDEVAKRQWSVKV